MSLEPGMEAATSAYDETYYRSHCGDIPYERSDHWLKFFHGIADHLVRSLRPRRVLDAGCAMGFLVEALWERGVEAYGIDISEYAIREVRMDVQPYCRQASLTEPITDRFDLITCIEVLEHIPDEDARKTLHNLTSATDTILFSSSPTDLTEPTHVNVRPTISWLHLFGAENFAPDLLFDATFVAPHAILLRRVAETPPEDVLVLFADLVRYRLTLADRQRQLDHFRNQAAELKSGKASAEGDAATLNHQLNLLRVERHQQEQELASRAAEIARLAQQVNDVAEARAAEIARLTQQVNDTAEARAAEIARLTQQVNDTAEARAAEIARLTHAEADAATLNHQLHLLRVERHQQEQELASRAAEIARLAQQVNDAAEARAAEIARLTQQVNDTAEARAAEIARLTQQVNDTAEARAAEIARLTHAEADAATLNHQLHLLRVERHQQEQELASRAAEIARLAQQVNDAAEAGAAEIAEIGNTISNLTETVSILDTRSDRLGMRLGGVESRLFHVGQQTEEILQSRIWRTLRAGAGLLLAPGAIFRSRPPRTAPAPPAAAATSDTDFLGLACDEPRPNEAEPHTGKIAVRGWALASSGIDRVEVSLPGGAARAEIGEVRPDIARVYPDTPGARMSGFTAGIDSAAVPNGLHILSVRAFSRAGAVREVQAPVRVDHDAGYASDYDRWIAEFETRNGSLIQLKLRSLALKPLVSLVTPVYRTPVEVLRRTIESVRSQSYSNWELCIADDGSHAPEIERLLREFAAQDERIHVEFLETNGGIVHASNAALARATGEFVALLDHDDELAPDALFHVVEAINLQPDIDLLYSDEDKIDGNGRRYDPFFKPDWSPDLLLSENYLCHFLVAKRSLVMQAGAFRTGFDGSQDYDLVLRLTGQSRKIAHIPRVLYHWRSLATSTASFSGQKDYAATAAQRAIQEELNRRATAAQVVPGAIPGRWRVRYSLPAPPPVSIIIASGGKVDLLRNNLENLFGKTEYPNYEVVVIDNSRHEQIQTLVKSWPQPRRPLRCIDWRNEPFNYSAINNEAARRCKSPVLLFLNDDTTVQTPGWLDAMVELAARPEVGAVGAKLLYPDGRIQHAGVVMGLFDNCGHAFKGLAGDRQHYFDLPDVIRNVSAVTGACLMTRAEVFWEVGGFDEQVFAVAFNDIDLCLKIGRKGYRVLYTPHALLYHHEAFSKTSRDLVPNPDEVRAMQEKWKDVIAADPFYSPNLTRTAEDYSLRRKV